MMDEFTLRLAYGHMNMGNYDKALEILTSNIEDKENESVYGALSICYARLKEYEKALLYAHKVLKYCYLVDNKRAIATSLLNIGGIYLDMHKNDKALIYFNKSLLMAEKLKHPIIKINSLINISEIYQNKKEFNEAKKKYLDVLKLAKDSGFPKQEIYVYTRLKEIAIEEKKYKSALRYTEKLNQIQDSLNKLQKDSEIAKLEVQYETIKKEKQITALKNAEIQNTLELERQQSQKYSLMYTFILILIPLAVLLFLYNQRLKNQRLLNKKQKEIGEQKIDTLIKDQELKLIKTSIDVQDKERKRIAQELHDSIGGNLAAIKLQFSAFKEKSENLATIYKQLDETYNQVRILSHDLIPEKFKRGNFIDLVKKYMKNISEASEVDIAIVTYQENKISDLKPLYHNELFNVFKELITNTMKHANASKVQIQIDHTEDSIYIVYEDNGKGFDTAFSNQGIGLLNMKNRINKMSGIINIDSRFGEGTIYNIEIPLETIQNNTARNFV